ncbi:MAG: RNA polymerase sigma-70 factor [Prevotellaceae bacterium]|jgi:RNA polymerase sigma-70 factor (ECF subfamily)|nr:RNA polymerase sigma-70 factor [Prevotellaceae bacterium]
MAEDIRETIRLLSTGNRSAFNRFYERFYEQVFHFAFYFLKEKESCKEIVSDVFFSVWQNREKLPEVLEIESWLYVLTRNRSLRYLEQNKKRAVISFDEIDDFSKVNSVYFEKENPPTPYTQLLDEELELILKEAVNSLPAKCRMIFIMSRKNGLKTKEIAEILNLQEATIRVQLKIAVEKIVAMLKPRFPELFK